MPKLKEIIQNLHGPQLIDFPSPLKEAQKRMEARMGHLDARARVVVLDVHGRLLGVKRQQLCCLVKKGGLSIDIVCTFH